MSDLPTLAWKIGVEIELMAPAGRSRLALAERVAWARGGSVRCFFHPQSEPSKAPGVPVFENLTLGFELVNTDGKRIAAFVDDLTLQASLDKRRAPLPGWWRIVADDARLLRLAIRHCRADAPLETVLDPLAALFGTTVQRREGGVMRVEDDRGVSVALGAFLPGERERPCEIVTPPLEANHAARLEELLGHARALGFTVPLEGATHLHFNAAPLCSAPVISRLVAVLEAHGAALRALVGVNPYCIRLGDWPPELAELTRGDAFRRMDWPAARRALAGVGLTKYCDFNLVNLVNGHADKHTFEVRILPASLHAAPIVAAAAVFERLLSWCVRTASSGSGVPLFPVLAGEFALPDAVWSALPGGDARLSA